MAKSKDAQDPEKVRYEGHDIDPSLEQKIDELMQIEEKPKVAESKAKIEVDEDDEPEITEADLPKKISIAVDDHSDSDEESLPASAPPLPGKDTAKTKDGIPEDAEDSPKDFEDTTDTAALETEVEEPRTEPEKVDAVEVDEVAESDAPSEEDIDESLTIAEAMEQVDELGLEDAQTGKAVDEIIASEADEILAAEDEKKGIEPAHDAAPIKKAAKKPATGSKIKRFFHAWLHQAKYRRATIAVLFAVLAVVAVVPSSRYYVLNSVGVRASISTRTVDEKTGQPLKNVEMKIDGKSAKSDKEGFVRIDGVKLGPQQVSIAKPAFADISRTITIGWGSNPQEETRLTPTGLQFRFLVTGLLSGQPVMTAEAESGDASARANDKGEIVLTIPRQQKTEESLEVFIIADNYRKETFTIPTASKEERAVQLVPAKKQAFISKRSGKYDLYKIDVDGKNEQKVLPGTGLERDDTLALSVHPKKEVAALISTRDNIRNGGGFLLSTLSLVDLESGETTRIAQSERIQLIDWIGNTLVYVKIAQGESEASASRHRLASYNIETKTEKDLASTNYFNDVIAARGVIYYAPAAYQASEPVGLFKISADGTNKRTIYEKEVWNLFRTSYEKVSVSVGQSWFELNLDGDGFSKANGAPSALKSRVYVDSPNMERSIWVDERDGKGVLVVYDIKTREDRVIATQSGLKNPIRWLDDEHVVYRVANGQETADYVLSLKGGESKKIRDVTNSSGIDRWYYY